MTLLLHDNAVYFCDVLLFTACNNADLKERPFERDIVRTLLFYINAVYVRRVIIYGSLSRL